MSPLAATLNFTINRFRPMGGIFPISATMELGTVTPENFTVHGKNLNISLPNGYSGAVTLTFQLNDNAHVLLGIAFAANEEGSTSLGRTEFPTVALTRLGNSSTMVVSDSCTPSQNGVRFNYVILVQSVRTGEIGIIDPEIETDIEP